MNYALEQDVVWGSPGLFTKDAEVDIGVGWLLLVEEMLVELGSCNLRISGIKEETILGCTRLSIAVPISLVEQDNHIISILQKYTEKSLHTCSVSGEYTQPFQENELG